MTSMMTCARAIVIDCNSYCSAVASGSAVTVMTSMALGGMCPHHLLTAVLIAELLLQALLNHLKCPSLSILIHLLQGCGLSFC